jgi:hypothetical protein
MYISRTNMTEIGANKHKLVDHHVLFSWEGLIFDSITGKSTAKRRLLRIQNYGYK